MGRGPIVSVGACAVLLMAGAAGASPKSDEDAAFAARLAALKKQSTSSVIQVQMAANEDPAKLPDVPSTGGVVLVANQRLGIYTPPLLSSDDIRLVVNQNMVDIRACFKKQLAEDPEWNDELILDLAIKKTGRVSEVAIAPGRARRATIGECLMSAVPKWKFPEFSGETDDGMVQEVVNASFPFSFSTP